MAVIFYLNFIVLIRIKRKKKKKHHQNIFCTSCIKMWS
ncbi:hypothetical protein NC653_027990 [Populus alba x Populus x berolinensis]|uniref:Uncharacterized protein n=1 Tax=Populus alba x Populus x berolinensis TaxID=444605 RepID=A0AAD6M961_9ROSI|nr:hypothetical protein NC653_027990 [Populus alba x Populus x berolinensis]